MANLIYDKKEIEKTIDSIVKRTMRMDLTWDWPGGVAYYGVCEAYLATGNKEYIELLKDRIDEYNEAWHDGWYHTGDTAWQDEDGFIWYVGRTDDVIKSSGYRIGPFEIENVIMELPYVLECAVTGAPDPQGVRGIVVKASITLVKGSREPSDELVKEIQNYVKEKTAPYKYPRIVEFVDELPKTISGKIRRAAIRGEAKDTVTTQDSLDTSKKD